MSQNKIFSFKNSYSKLNSKLYAEVEVSPLQSGNVLLFNQELFEYLGGGSADSDEHIAYFTGNKKFQNQAPIAQAYAGHQFGHFTTLGDGRAALMGEISSPAGLFDLSFKGSGQTPYSRRGDGLATLASCVREYIVSECMHHMAVPSTRSLAVAFSREAVYREEIYERGLLARVASSHIRVGTFQFIRQYHSELLQEFLEYVRLRHFPELTQGPDMGINLFEAFCDRQIETVVHWYRIGFIHGVMNTDNMTLSGETIDYGPCSFMNAYNLETVYSSIDRTGRYAFGKQRDIALWNFIRFAESILPAIDKDPKMAVEKANRVIEGAVFRFEKRWLEMMHNKIGFSVITGNTELLVHDLLSILKKDGLDYTNVFVYLRDALVDKRSLFDIDFKHNEMLQNWLNRWMHEVGQGTVEAADLMKRTNPSIIPRNHVVEKLIDDAVQSKDATSINDFVSLIKQKKSLSELPPVEQEWLGKSPLGFDVNFRTYCGT